MVVRLASLSLSMNVPVTNGTMYSCQHHRQKSVSTPEDATDMLLSIESSANPFITNNVGSGPIENAASNVNVNVNVNLNANMNVNDNINVNVNDNMNANINANPNADADAQIHSKPNTMYLCCESIPSLSQQDHSLLPTLGKVDPVKVDKLLAEELNQMSFDRRKRVAEEVHGLIPQPRRSQEQLRADTIDPQTTESLSELQMQLDLLCDKRRQDHHHHHYRCSSTSSSSSSCAIPHSSLDAYHRAKTSNSKLLNDVEFRLSFLRAEEKDPTKAARRLVNYLGFVREVYETDDVLFRPIRFGDLNPKAQELCRSGIVQILPVRDTAGRRIMTRVRNFDPCTPFRLRQQMGMYMLQCLAEDPGGAVLIAFLHSASGMTMSNKCQRDTIDKFLSVSRVKLGAIHICAPNSPFHALSKAVFTMLVGKDNRPRLRFHTGSFSRCKASLKSFGIPVYHLPTSLSLDNACNLRGHRKWLTSRMALERATTGEVQQIRSFMKTVGVCRNDSATVNVKVDFDVEAKPHVTQSNLEPIFAESVEPSFESTCQTESDSAIEMTATRRVRSRFVDCPYHEDCIFGKGRWVMNHPGNVAMRCLLGKQLLWLSHHKNHHHHHQTGTVPSAEVARAVLVEIKMGHGRFLKVCSGSHDGLLEPVDDKTALHKISIAFRDLKIRLRREPPLAMALSSMPRPTRSRDCSGGSNSSGNSSSNSSVQESRNQQHPPA